MGTPARTRSGVARPVCCPTARIAGGKERRPPARSRACADASKTLGKRRLRGMTSALTSAVYVVIAAPRLAGWGDVAALGQRHPHRHPASVGSARYNQEQPRLSLAIAWRGEPSGHREETTIWGGPSEGKIVVAQAQWMSVKPVQRNREFNRLNDEGSIRFIRTVSASSPSLPSITR